MMNQNGGFLEQIPVVTKNLIIINLLFWVASLALPKAGIDLVDILGLHFVGAEDFYPFQIITYMFMHDTHSFAHVFFNMFAVYMFGRVLEQVWGPKRFLIFYMVTGIGAGLIQELTWLYDLRDVVYAPQELVNIGGGQILNKPEFYNLFVFVPIPIKAKYFVIFYGLAELFLGVASFHGDSVAHFAHLGGMLFGYILIRIWRKKSLNNGPFYI